MRKRPAARRETQAAALSYDVANGGAPRVTASGRGETAGRILELAHEHGVPLHKDPALVETLLALELGQEIPAQLYEVVAEILAFVYDLEKRSQL